MLLYAGIDLLQYSMVLYLTTFCPESQYELFYLAMLASPFQPLMAWQIQGGNVEGTGWSLVHTHMSGGQNPRAQLFEHHLQKVKVVDLISVYH